MKRFAGRFTGMFLLALFLLTAPAAFAQAENGPLEIQLTAYKVVPGEAGKEELLPADFARPGDVIEYQAVYRNRSENPLGNVSAVVPIPEGLEYLPDTAVPGNVQASADGQTFAPAPLLREVRLASGKVEERPVPLVEYRALRWGLGTLEPGQEVMVKARARLVATQ